MSWVSPTSASTANLERRIGLRSAVLFNMLEMIGVGPFITLPLVIAAAGFRLSVWAWVLGAAIAVADGLVWAELGAAFRAPADRMRFCARSTGRTARATG
jgi:amino acid transporter